MQFTKSFTQLLPADIIGFILNQPILSNNRVILQPVWIVRTTLLDIQLIKNLNHGK